MKPSASRFRTGDIVQVRESDPPFHHRTPWYVKGKVGSVDAVYDPWPNPEEMAYGKFDGRRIPLYRIAFEQRDLWEHYEGPAGDRLVVDIFEHWLEPASNRSER